jgi:hypothetical protein
VYNSSSLEEKNMKKSLNNFIGDELANKVKILSGALFQAEKIIYTLEQENRNLKDVLNNLTSENKEGCASLYEATSVQ